MIAPADLPSDPGYQSRHASRTLQRARRIADHISTPGKLLDVGCNTGVTSRHLLDVGKAIQVTGIELVASTVDSALRAHPDFDLIEGDVADLDLDQRFDYVVYGAVHHHVLNRHGLTAAIETFQKLANLCTRSLYFETGQVGEGGRWPWQRALRRHFRTDEEHFFYMLRSIEHLIDGFEVIGKFRIHGINRAYLRIDISQGRRAEPADTPRIGWPQHADGPYARSFGSRDQSLYRQDATARDASPTLFWITPAADTPGRFIKKHRHHPRAADAEWCIGQQIKKSWAVRPVARTTPEDALVFPHLQDAVPITRFVAAAETCRRALAAMVLQIFDDARTITVCLPDGVLLPVAGKANLWDIVDLNPNNLLITGDGDELTVRVVDFEQQSHHYAYRNRMHLARILWVLRQRRLTALVNYLSGVAGGLLTLFAYQRLSFGDRISARQPSFMSVLIAEVRSVSGRTSSRLLGLAGIE